jgi:hypothetical protein
VLIADLDKENQKILFTLKRDMTPTEISEA